MRPDSVSSEQNGFFKGYCILGDVWTSQESRGSAGVGGRGEPGLQSGGCLGVVGRGMRCYWPVVLLSRVLAEPG